MTDAELMSLAATSFLAVAAVAAFAIYFLPTFVAANNKHPHVGAIFVLNLLAGFTVIGWVAAFIWAFISPPQSGTVFVTHQMPMPMPPRRRIP